MQQALGSLLAVQVICRGLTALLGVALPAC